MTNFAWVIDQTSCIGCHACTTACKAENSVPLGVNRTWVKYVETGVFPQTRRRIAVLRRNHCAEPPCVEVCPTAAMFQRADGIVDFDVARCIGCKACLQACPYHAIYIDPEEHVAEKCFCAQRVDRGLLPARARARARAEPEDREGDIFVDTAASRRVYGEWLTLARPGPGPGACADRSGSSGRCDRPARPIASAIP